MQEKVILIDNDREILVPENMLISPNHRVKIGDVFYKKDDSYFFDKDATEIRHKEIVELQNTLWDD